MQLRKNYETNKEKMEWFQSKEIRGRRWKSDATYEQISKIGLQTDFNFGTGAGCQAGFCTD